LGVANTAAGASKALDDYRESAILLCFPAPSRSLGVKTTTCTTEDQRKIKRNAGNRIGLNISVSMIERGGS